MQGKKDNVILTELITEYLQQPSEKKFVQIDKIIRPIIKNMLIKFGGKIWLHSRDVDDLTQEVVVKFFQSLSNGYNPKAGSTVAYLQAMAVNYFIDLKRKKVFCKREYTHQMGLTEDFHSLDEKAERLSLVIPELKKIEQDVLMNYLSGFKYKEIGIMFNIPRNSIAQHLHKAKKNLRARLVENKIC